MIADAHCHFFSSGFLRALGREAGIPDDAEIALSKKLGWDAPGSDNVLADRWVAELDRHGVSRAMLIASVPGDEASVAAAVVAHPSRFVGAFMFNPAAADAEARLERAFVELGLSTVCVFPAMHHVGVGDPPVTRVFEFAARHRRAVFVHCGVLSVGVRAKLGLPSRFDLRLGDPLAVAAIAVRHPDVPVIIPHFGAGRLTEALMAAAAAPNILLDTSSSNSWIKFHPHLTLRDVWARAIDIVGPTRMLFGTDSSFFPRGWQRALYDVQCGVLDELGIGADHRGLILGGNFARIFPERRS
jgi:predicted TIM-barrel fold metal-dependent hydrolase